PVRISAPAPGRYQSVLVTAEEEGPQAGAAGSDATATLTMADPRDQRRTQRLLPAGPHRWEGRFTPELIGRYTGTVVLECGDDREIGLVPLLRVKPSIRRGFLRSVAPRGRMFYAGAGGLFPMGIVLLDAPQF